MQSNQILLTATGVALGLSAPVFAQQTTAPAPSPSPAAKAPAKAAPAAKPLYSVGGFNITAALRSRVENWGWFDTPGFDDSYTFTGSQLRVSALKSTPRTDFQVDLMEVIETGIPDKAVAPPPLGALGQGGNYFAANGNQDGALSLKQGFVRFKGINGPGSSLRLGRFEFNDGTETTVKDPTLSWLKAQRISQRLIGTFGYTHTGRAFDGVHFTTPVGKANLTTVLARPTEGVFQLQANDEIDATDFAYGAYTLPVKSGEARLFGMWYEDGRTSPKSVKTDNRPLAVRTLDSDDIQVFTLGGNYIQDFDTTSGKFDVLAWGAIQGGDWGQQDHSGNAFAFEGGYQPKNVKWRPWLRAGYYQASGDGNATDGKHKTFFTPLPTPRVYARFPFYNQMNSKDLFVQAIARPNPKLTLRSEAHKLKLDNSNDLWYAGGGAFQDTGFGIAGRPSGGSTDLGTLLDISADYALNAKTGITLYYGHMNGGKVISTTYPSGDSAHLAYAEINYKF
jgi:hypothetical protein